MEAPQGTAAVFVPPHTVLGGETLMSLVFAHMFMDARQATLDNQANARAYNALSLRKANNSETIDNRGAKNGETSDHFANTGVTIATQTGETENQASVDPERTGTGDDIADDKASTLSAEDAAKIAGAVAGAGQAVNADSTNANNLTAQAFALIQAIATANGLKVSITTPPAAA